MTNLLNMYLCPDLTGSIIFDGFFINFPENRFLFHEFPSGQIATWKESGVYCSLLALCCGERLAWMNLAIVGRSGTRMFGHCSAHARKVRVPSSSTMYLPASAVRSAPVYFFSLRATQSGFHMPASGVYGVFGVRFKQCSNPDILYSI